MRNGHDAPDRLLARLRGEGAPAAEAPDSPAVRTLSPPAGRHLLVRCAAGAAAVLLVALLLWTKFSPAAGVSRLDHGARSPQAEQTAASRHPESARVRPASASTATANATPGKVVVDVGGLVRNPGVYTLPAGSRIADALARAGGTLPEADLSGINRAALLADAVKILVPRAGGHGSQAPAALPPVMTEAPRGGADGGRGSSDPEKVVNLNTADEATLQTLPKIGPVLAKRIVEDRAAHGAYRSVDDLSRVKGCGPSVIESIRPHATVSPSP